MDPETSKIVGSIRENCEKLHSFVMDYQSSMTSTKGSGSGTGRLWYRAPDSLRTEHNSEGRTTNTVQIGTRYSTYIIGKEFVYDCDLSEAAGTDPFLQLASLPSPNSLLRLINPETLQYLGRTIVEEHEAYKLKGTIEREFDTFGKKNIVAVNLSLQIDIASGLLLNYEANIQTKDIQLSTKTSFRIVELNVDIGDAVFQIDTQGANVRHADIGQMIRDAHRKDGGVGPSLN